MLRFVSIIARKSRLARFCWAFAASALLAAGGCANLDLRGESFPDDPMSDLAGRLRNVDHDAQSFAFSNKARQIDKNLGTPR